MLPTQNDNLEATMLSNGATYTRAVLKEVLRLNPISIGVGRITNFDLVLGGYHVPKGVSRKL